MFPYAPQVEQTMKTMYTSLREKDRRRYAAVEAAKLEHGGIKYISELFGCDPKTIRQGEFDLCGPARCSTRAVPKKRGGRKRLIDTQPQLQPSFQKVLEDHTAGDPMKPDSLWTNLSVRPSPTAWPKLGTPVDRTIVEQLLDQANSAIVNCLKITTMDYSRDRNQQFETISLYRKIYLDSLNPILSVDTKKRELLGDFYRDGQAFTTRPIRVFDHDYPSFADGHVIPHGIFDLKRNRGYINLGGSHDTSEFACDSLFQWWTTEGHAAWPRCQLAAAALRRRRQ